MVNTRQSLETEVRGSQGSQFRIIGDSGTVPESLQLSLARTCFDKCNLVKLAWLFAIVVLLCVGVI